MAKKPVKKAIKAKSLWLGIEQAIVLFESLEAFIRATYDGQVITRGKRFDDCYHGEEIPHSEIDKELWGVCTYDETSKRLSGSDDKVSAPMEYHYYDIEVSRKSLVDFVFTNNPVFATKGASELYLAIFTVLKDTIIEGGFYFPSAALVMQNLKKRQTEFKCITKIERDKNGTETIYWTNLDGSNDSTLGMGGLRNNMHPYEVVLEPALA